MQRKPLAILISGFMIAGAGAYALKKPPAASTRPTLTGDERILHALNRLTFGPRTGDIEAIRRIGLDRWIAQQLYPEHIPENPVLEAKLAPLDTLRASTAELLAKYPTPQMARAMLEGRIPFPSDPAQRILVDNLIARFERKQLPEQNSRAKPDIADVPLDSHSREVLETGSPEARASLIESMPEQEQMQTLAALAPADLRRLYDPAPPALRRKILSFRGPAQVVTQDLIDGKLLRAVYSNRQLEEVLTDFWYNHFNVFLDKGADRYLVTTYERDVIRPHVLGSFHDLLLATAQSPAMLFYLDNWQSAAPDARVNPNRRRERGLNENYARELMELHTLGVDGGYTQKDVTEVARCFTGWTIRDPRRGGGFEFHERMHDRGEKHVLGETIPAGGGIEDGLKVIDILAGHPSTAHFISKQLATRFVSDDPPSSLVDRMAKTFLDTHGNLREVMKTMIASPEFWDPAVFRCKVKSPLEMVASAIRAAGADIGYGFAIETVLNRLGEPLYRKQEPTGYSNRGADWLNSASLMARMNFAIALANNRIAGVKIEEAKFTGDGPTIEREILFSDPSAETRAAIESAVGGPLPPGVKSQQTFIAGLVLGSPDFQRR